MSEKLELPGSVEGARSETEYTPPRIEKVMTQGDLEREVHYAGAEDGISLRSEP